MIMDNKPGVYKRVFEVSVINSIETVLFLPCSRILERFSAEIFMSPGVLS
jgi:hypothetical protein